MSFLAFWVLFAIAIGIWAANKGRSSVAWILLALIISPLLAALFLAVSSDISPKPALAYDAPKPETHVQCPDCAEFVRKEARVCKHCGCKLTPVALESAPENNKFEPWQIVGIIIALLLAYGIYSAR